MKKILYSIPLVFCIFLSSAQTGYMGKHVHVGYAFHTSPAFFNANANQKSIIGQYGSAETGSFAFNVSHEAFLDYLLSSKWIIGVSAKFYKTSYDNSMQYYSNFSSPYNYSYASSSREGNERPEGFYSIKGTSYALCFKYFGSRYVAPWGRYVMFGPVVNSYKATYDPKVMYDQLSYYDGNNYYGSYYTDTLFSNYGATEQSFTRVGLMVGWGRCRIIANRISIDYGVNAQPLALIANVLRTTGYTGAFIKNQYYSDDYIKESSKRRIQGFNSVNIFLKIGILLF